MCTSGATEATLKMEAARSSETLVTVYPTTQCQILVSWNVVSAVLTPRKDVIHS